MEAEGLVTVENGQGHHNGPGFLQRNCRKGSTLHRESEIKLETAEADPRDNMPQVLRSRDVSLVAKCKEGGRQPVAEAGMGEFERRLLQAKRLRRTPLPDVLGIR